MSITALLNNFIVKDISNIILDYIYYKDKTYVKALNDEYHTIFIIDTSIGRYNYRYLNSPILHGVEKYFYVWSRYIGKLASLPKRYRYSSGLDDKNGWK